MIFWTNSQFHTIDLFCPTCLSYQAVYLSSKKECLGNKKRKVLSFVILTGGFKRASQIKQKLAKGESISSRSLSLRRWIYLAFTPNTFYPPLGKWSSPENGEGDKQRSGKKAERYILPVISEYIICLESLYSLIYYVFNTMLGTVANSKETEDALYSRTQLICRLKKKCTT